MLITIKRKIEIPLLKIFDASIQYQRSVKYLGVNIDSKLTWSTHIAQKTLKALSTLWMCKSAISHTWGLGLRYPKKPAQARSQTNTMDITVNHPSRFPSRRSCLVDYTLKDFLCWENCQKSTDQRSFSHVEPLALP